MQNASLFFFFFASCKGTYSSVSSEDPLNCTEGDEFVPLNCQICAFICLFVLNFDLLCVKFFDRNLIFHVSGLFNEFLHFWEKSEIKK